MGTVPDVFSPVRLGPITLRNRIIKAATFEARTPQALVSDDLIAFHRAMAAGGRVADRVCAGTATFCIWMPARMCSALPSSAR